MQPNVYSQKLVKSVSFYLERFQRYGVLENVQLFGPPCTRKNDQIQRYNVALSEFSSHDIRYARRRRCEQAIGCATHSSCCDTVEPCSQQTN